MCCFIHILSARLFALCAPPPLFLIVVLRVLRLAQGLQLEFYFYEHVAGGTERGSQAEGAAELSYGT